MEVKNSNKSDSIQLIQRQTSVRSNKTIPVAIESENPADNIKKQIRIKNDSEKDKKVEKKRKKRKHSFESIDLGKLSSLFVNLFHLFSRVDKV